jgi:hypothetical protein
VNEKFAEGVTKTPANLERAQRIISAGAMDDHALEAAAHAEVVIRFLQAEWGERGFTPEQCVFSVALATINLREGVPEKYGGKEMFDRIATEAQKYFNANR